ncbi:MAG: transcription-repair coupling factor, partial [Desulfatirhabdiaceae bacterium]
MINQEKNNFKRLSDSLFNRQTPIDCSGLSGSSAAWILARLWRDKPVPMVVVTPNAKDAERTIQDMQFFAGENLPILEFPAYNLMTLKLVSLNGTAATRLYTLYQLMNSFHPPLVVTSAEALLQGVIPRQELAQYCDLIQVNEDIDLDRIVEKLVSGGYSRSMIVEEPGDFCIRGGIVDIFSPLYPDPVRIELFGDMVESIRFFSAANQRTIRSIDEMVIIPAREAIVRLSDMDTLISRIWEQATSMDLPATAVRDLIERIRQEGIFPGIENLAPLIYAKMDHFFDYVPDHALCVLIEPEEIEKSANQFMEKAIKNHLNAIRDQQVHLLPEQLYVTWSDIAHELKERLPLSLRAISTPLSQKFKSGGSLSIEMQVGDNHSLQETLTAQREKEHILQPLAAWIQEQKQLGAMTVAACSTPSQAERLDALLRPYGIAS